MRNFIFIFLGFLFSLETNAQVDCKGTITRLALHIDSGVLILGLSSGPWAINMCSVSTVFNNISPESCKVLYSTLLATKASGKQSVIRFYDLDSCTDPDVQWKNAGRLGWSDHMLD